jgi:hypothetical protein
MCHPRSNNMLKGMCIRMFIHLLKYEREANNWLAEPSYQWMLCHRIILLLLLIIINLIILRK